MSQMITATMENGVLKPDHETGIASGTRVRVLIEPYVDDAEDSGHVCDELDRLCEEFPVTSDGDMLTRDQLHERG